MTEKLPIDRTKGTKNGSNFIRTKYGANTTETLHEEYLKNSRKKYEKIWSKITR
jgi:hypothetical protein